MITNVDYLIQKYAEAREKINEANDNYGITYWRGVMDTYHNLLCNSFGNWAEYGTAGYYVFYELMHLHKTHAQTVLFLLKNHHLLHVS